MELISRPAHAPREPAVWDGCPRHRAGLTPSLLVQSLSSLDRPLSLIVLASSRTRDGQRAIAAARRLAAASGLISARVIPPIGGRSHTRVDDLLEFSGPSSRCECCLLNAVHRAEGLNLAPWL